MAPIIEIAEGILETLNPEKYTRRYDLEEDTSVTPQPTQTTETQEPITIDYEPDPSDYIFVQGIKSGKEKRPDLRVCKYRLSADSAVEQAGERLGIRAGNTAKERNGRGYVGNINRGQALKLNLFLGGRTSNARLARDFLRLVFSGKAEDGNRKKVKTTELDNIADEITAKRAPYRGEWCEDYLTQGKKGMVLNKNYVMQDNILVPEYSSELITCLMEDRYVDLQSWLKNSTVQGFSKENTKSGNSFYWPFPRPDSAVGFCASPDDAYFICDRYPLYSDPRLGVRHVHEAHAKK